MRRVAVTIAVALPALLAVQTAHAATADLKLRKVATSSTAARVGDRVVFKAYARNLGPGSSDLFVTYSDARHLRVRREVCLVPSSEAGDFDAPSPDTPSCEYSDVPQGDFVVVRVGAFIGGNPGRTASLTFCTSNGTGLPDPDPSNDCATARIPITG